MSGQTPKIDIVTVTSTSTTLAALLTAASSALREGMRVTIVPHASGIYMDDGTASASSHPMGLSSHEVEGDVDTLATMQFYAASNTTMTVIQEDPR